MERLAQKLRRIILLQFGLVTFRMNFGKTQKDLMFMVSGLAGRVHDSQNQYYLSLETPRYLQPFKKNKIEDRDVIWNALTCPGSWNTCDLNYLEYLPPRVFPHFEI